MRVLGIDTMLCGGIKDNSMFCRCPTLWFTQAVVASAKFWFMNNEDVATL